MTRRTSSRIRAARCTTIRTVHLALIAAAVGALAGPANDPYSLRVRRSHRMTAVAISLLLLSLPVAAVMTVGLLPLWSWIESRYGIESVGHSGPAGWCNLAVYLTCVGAAGPVWCTRHRRGNPGEQSHQEES